MKNILCRRFHPPPGLSPRGSRKERTLLQVPQVVHPLNLHPLPQFNQSINSHTEIISKVMLEAKVRKEHDNALQCHGF